MVQRKRTTIAPAISPAARVRFAREFGVEPVEGEGAKAQMDRSLERIIVAHHLISIWRRILQCRFVLRQRDPAKWLGKPGERPGGTRKQLSADLRRLDRKLARAERLARTFGLHPEMPFKIE